MFPAVMPWPMTVYVLILEQQKLHVGTEIWLQNQNKVFSSIIQLTTSQIRVEHVQSQE
jgi:hypothetical protein